MLHIAIICGGLFVIVKGSLNIAVIRGGLFEIGMGALHIGIICGGLFVIVKGSLNIAVIRGGLFEIGMGALHIGIIFCDIFPVGKGKPDLLPVGKAAGSLFMRSVIFQRVEFLIQRIQPCHKHGLACIHPYRIAAIEICNQLRKLRFLFPVIVGALSKKLLQDLPECHVIIQGIIVHSSIQIGIGAGKGEIIFRAF